MAAVEEITESSDEVFDALNKLLPQLSSSAPGISREDFESIVASDSVRLLIARNDSGNIVGCLSLAVFRIPTGLRAWIEDVVVDDEARGQGIGELLTKAAIGLAAKHGVRTVDLTSRPSREAANRLYERCGFSLRETNVYRYTN